MKRDFLSLTDVTAAELERLVYFACALKRRQQRGEVAELLRGKTLALLFQKPSLRTRASFEVGMHQLGGFTTYFHHQDVGLGVREPLKDLGRVLSRYYSAIVMRTFAHSDLVALARAATVPVINALTDLLHPCQILAALQTLYEHFGRLAGLHVAYVGDGNNVAHSWLLGAATLGLRLTLACPPAYRPQAEVWRQAQALAATSGAVLEIVDDPVQGVKGADAVYTDVWASMGQEAEAEVRRQVFRPYQVNRTLLEAAPSHAVVMHCLPAHRGEEITEEVLEGPRSLVFEEAENRLHAQKALLVFLLAPERMSL
ncbi:MAG: ornithine carbamoyltransferase, catabolic [Candidatus Tectimicrobiota bacterium]|nr:MAG: ornithine carbamoyltransferase, catabolic [Candidatus Tectomicrobia bacterium]